MSLRDAAQHLAQYGRHGDTMLAHINPQEAALLKAHGGSGTTNPHTGLPEFFGLGDLNPVRIIQGKGEIGEAIGPAIPLLAGAALGPAGYGLTAMQAGLITGGVMSLATGSLQKGLMAGLGAYGGAGLSEGLLGAAGAGGSPTLQALQSNIDPAQLESMSAAQVAATGDFGQKASILGEGARNLTGEAGRAGFMQGVGGGRELAKYGLAATLPIMAGSGVQTTTGLPSTPQAPGWIRPFSYDPRTQGLQALTPIRASSIYAEGGVVQPSDDGNVHAFGGGWMSDIVDDIKAALDRQKTVAPEQPQPQQPAFLDRDKQAAIQQQLLQDSQQRVAQFQAAQDAQQRALTTPFQEPATQAQGALSQAIAMAPPRMASAANPMTGDSAAAFNYLMGKSDYPYITQDKEVFRPYTEILAQKATGSTPPPSQGVTPMPEVKFPQQPQQSQQPAFIYNPITKKFEIPTPGVPTPITPPEDTGIDTSQTPYYAQGGIAAAADHYNLGGYSDGGRLLRGPGDGVSDSIPATIGRNRQPARLADGEFVVPARIVSELGNGSTEAGARKLYAMMDRIQKARSKTVGKGRVAKNTRADKYLPA